MKRNRPLDQTKRKLIINAAIEEFHKNGFGGTSMDIISKKANVSKATIYNHFKNKEELFLTLSDILHKRLKENFTYPYNNNISIKEQLYKLARKEIDFLNIEENNILIKIIIVAMIHRNDIGLKIINSAQDNCLLMATKWFEDAKNDGKLKFENASFVSQQFIGMIKSFVFYPQMYGKKVLTEEEIEKTISSSILMIEKMYMI